MKKVEAYKTSSGMIEENIERAYAWELHTLLSKVAKQTSESSSGPSFSNCILIMKNYKSIISLLTLYKNESNDK